MQTWLRKFCTGFIKATGYLPGIAYFKPRVVLAPGARRQLPKGCILISNHKSLMDFVLYLMVFPFRSVRFLAAEVLFNKGKAMSTLLYSLGCIRVDRDAKSFDFVSTSIEALDRGETLGIFPEGRLPVEGKPFPFTVSTAFIALQTNATVVPVYTDGVYGLFKRTGVVIGEAFTPADHCKSGLTQAEQLEQLTNLLHHRVYSLRDHL